jgi:hypothetical protein
MHGRQHRDRFLGQVDAGKNLGALGNARQALMQDGRIEMVEVQKNVVLVFADAPALNPARTSITGLICGIRVEEIEDPLMQRVRQLDKLVDEVAKGKKMTSILRTSA